MAASVGTLKAQLTVDTGAWSSGLAKAQREFDKTVKGIEASAKSMHGLDLDAIRRTLGSTARDKLDVQRQLAQAAYMPTKLADGQAMVARRVMSRNELPGIMAGIREQSSSGIENVVRLGAALAVVRAALDSAVVGAKLFSGELKWGADAAAEIAKTIPILGQSLASAIDYGSGADIRAELKQNEKAATRLRAQIEGRKRSILENWGDQFRGIQQEHALSGKEGIELKMGRIEFERVNRLDELKKQYGQVVNHTKDVQDRYAQMQAAINSDAARQQQEAIAAEQIERERTERERVRAAVAADSEILQSRLRLVGRENDAELVALAGAADERIRAAKEAGDGELAARLETLKGLELARARQQQAEVGTATQIHSKTLAATVAPGFATPDRLAGLSMTPMGGDLTGGGPARVQGLDELINLTRQMVAALNSGLPARAA